MRTLDWVRERLEHRHDLGVSSHALLAYAIGGDDPGRPYGCPADLSDLGRCLRLYESAPDRLKRRMRPVLCRWVREVSIRYPEAVDRARAVDPALAPVGDNS